MLVVDNHSDDDSIGYLRNRARGVERVRIIESPRNSGYGQGNALGAQHATGEFLLIINPDNVLEPDGLRRMVDAMQADPDIGILAPRLVHEDGTVRESARAFPAMLDVVAKRSFLRQVFPHRIRRYLLLDEDPSAVRDTDWVVGACLLLRTAFFRELGGFDPGFFLFFEDTDICRRCWKAGKRVTYLPSVTALDRKARLSDGGILTLLTKKTARVHLGSALRYFWKWRREGLRR